MKNEHWIIRILKTPFRLHDFDLLNPSCINQGSLDKDVTGEPHALLYFVVFCKNCGKHVQVNHETYILGKLPLRKRLFCHHRPEAYYQHLEKAQEREAEMASMTFDDYQLINKWFESKDIDLESKESQIEGQKYLDAIFKDRK